VTETAFAVLAAGAFVASVVNAMFSAGGALIILALTSTVLPVSAVVPIHSTLLIGSTSTRAFAFREHIDWSITRSFLAGSVVGAVIGSRVYFSLPDDLIRASIATLMLVAIWLPSLKWRPRIRHPWTIVGFVHTLLSTLFAYGAVFQGVILHTALKRREVIGTVGGCLTGMGLLKIGGYALNGFDYRPYLPVIATAIALSFAGTWIGRHFVEKISERLFRIVFRILITVTALRLIWLSLA